VIRAGRDETGNKRCERRISMTQTANVDIAHADIAATIKAHPVVLFMKGTPARPQCGFSATVVEVLRHYDNIPIHAIDVLVNPPIRQAIKTYSDWPTVPQLYLNGTFVGGCDIVQEMHETGELAELIAGVEKQIAS
jgi:monothiol glutaredoxin